MVMLISGGTCVLLACNHILCFFIVKHKLHGHIALWKSEVIVFSRISSTRGWPLFNSYYSMKSYETWMNRKHKVDTKSGPKHSCRIFSTDTIIVWSQENADSFHKTELKTLIIYCICAFINQSYKFYDSVSPLHPAYNYPRQDEPNLPSRTTSKSA